MRPLDQSDAARDTRIAWHQEARFGCFVHWGVYSDPAGEWKGQRSGVYAEHLMRFLKIPRQVYLEEIAQPFNPAAFDADAWVRRMRDAGMRYLIITAKHHDGFAMYPSKVSDFDLADATSFKRDPMAELSAACKQYGLKFGFYYSHAFDWEHPDAPGNDWDYENPGGDRKLHGGVTWYRQHPELVAKARRYIERKSIPQIQELLRTYKPDILWFDTPSKLSEEDNLRILRAVRETDAEVVVNGRVVFGNKYGDYKNTADRPAYFPETPGHWESIPTTNESYGYHRHDHSHKPPAHFIQLLAMTVGKGGNMLLNIGPRGDGTIDPVDEKILEGIGGWMTRYGESIYGCDRTPLPIQPWGTSTRKGNRLFLHVFQWPADGRLVVGGLRSDPGSARLLATSAGGGALAVRRLNADDVEIALPNAAPDAADSVLVLDFPAEIEANKAIRVAPAREATLLHVMDGTLQGSGVRFGDGKRHNDVIDEWSEAGTGVTWTVRAPAPARFRLSVDYATHTPEDGGVFAVAVAGQKIERRVSATEKRTAFRDDTLGEIALPAGEHRITVLANGVTGGNLMRLRQLELTPLGDIPR